MGESSPAVTHAWLHPDVLLNFIEELRQADYNIGVAHYVAVQDLILALAARGEPLDQPYQLQTLLGPILCGSPSEQTDFQHRFDQWVQRMGFQPVPAATTAAAEALAQDLDDLEERSQRWLVWLLAAVGGAILLLLLFFFGGQLGNSLSRVTSAAPNLPNPSSIKNINVNPSLLTGALLAPILLFTGWRLWWRYRAQMFLERRSTTDEPEIERISIGGLDETLFPNVLFFRLAQAFRRRVDAPSSELDVEATVAATISQAGQFTPIYGRRQYHPEYLVLIDRAAFGDHQAHFMTSMVNRLAENEVFVTRYYFDGDPRLCFPADGDGAPSPLSELVALHHQHRLVLFTDASGLFNPRSGVPARWLAQFSAWPERTLLTPITQEHWGYRERELSRQFVILPATTDGLTALAHVLERGESEISANGQSRATFPAVLRDRPRLWTARDEPDETAVQEMLTAVRVYLGRAGYDWLAACAVYPELHWNLTLYLGETLKTANGDKLLHPDRLTALARLPWFRRGYLPDWLRVQLIESMPKTKEKAVRAALEALLVTAVQGDVDEFQLEIARAHGRSLPALARPLLRLLARDAADDNPITDYVFLNFMNGRRQKPLAVRLPEALSYRLQHQPTPTRSVPWRFLLRWMLSSVAGLGIGFLVAVIFASILSISQDSFLMGAVVGFLWGGGVGFMQWRALRHYQISSMWILASAPGLALGLGIVYSLLTDLPTSLSQGVLIGSVVGLISGTAQWSVLRHFLQRTELWIGVNIISWLASWLVFYSSEPITAANVIYGLALYVILSGLGMRWLLQFPHAGSEEPLPEPTVQPQASLDTLPRSPQHESFRQTISSLNWRLTRKWLYASVFGVITSIPLTMFILIIGLIFPLGLLFLLVGFVPVGYFQGRVLDRLGFNRKNWAKLSGTGWILGVVVAAIVLILVFSINLSSIAIIIALGFTLSGAVVGFFVGAAQWISLRQELDRANLWIWGQVIGLALGWGTLAVWAYTFPGLEIIFIILGILFYGLLTGVMLARLAPQAAAYSGTGDGLADATPQLANTVDGKRPWYRSRPAMWLAFLFLNPFWIILFLTDSDRKGWEKWVVGGIGLVEIYVLFSALFL